MSAERGSTSTKPKTMTHTPEPWTFQQGTLGVMHDDAAVCYPIENACIKPYEPVEFIKQPAEANARRIVACVNACAGMADPEKEIAAMRAAIAKAEGRAA